MKYIKISFLLASVAIFILSLQNILLVKINSSFDVLIHMLIVWSVLIFFTYSYKEIKKELKIAFSLAYILCIFIFKFFIYETLYFRELLLDLTLIIIYVELLNKKTLINILENFKKVK